MQRILCLAAAMLFSVIAQLITAPPATAKLTEKQIAAMVIPPFTLGPKDPKLPVYTLLNSGGTPAGYVFQTIDLIKIAGFSGTPMNLLVTMDFSGNFISIEIISQNEPVLVNGQLSMSLADFINQYNGLSVAQNIKVMLSTQKADQSKNQIDGIAMATASMRIMNETILVASLKIARNKLKGLNSRPSALAKTDYFEQKNWQQLLDEGLVTVHKFKNSDVEALFTGSDGENLDPIILENPDAPYAKIYLADLSIPTIAKSILTEASQQELKKHISHKSVPILIMAEGRHQLVGEDFIPASVPDNLNIKQNGLAINMRDTYINIELKPNLKRPEQAYIFRLDRRFGFDPAAPWLLHMKAIRKKGSFRPEIIKRELKAGYDAPNRFFDFPKADLRDESAPPWVGSWQAQTINLIILSTALIGLFYLLYFHQSWMASKTNLTYLRPAILLFTLIFIGWYGQAQLSIVTVIALVKTLKVNPDFSFLLYDPLSTILWGAVIMSFFIWGRGLFCGWLCPYGVMQDYSAKLGSWLGIKPIRLRYKTDKYLKYLKYIILVAIIGTALFWPSQAENIAEVEPFKTAVTLYFWRDWPFILYALMWLVISMFVFKAFCRYVCPLGAFLTLGEWLRIPNWIPRRQECGSPCQLCAVRCNYQSIEPKGQIKYSECFQCLDCVSIYDDKNLCVPEVLSQKASINKTDPQSKKVPA